MTDVLGWRKVLAVVGPSTNTVVQPDMERLRPPGVTNHYRSIYVEDPDLPTDLAFSGAALKVSEGVRESLRAAVTCKPDYLVLGVSAISFMGGLAGATKLVQELQDYTGLELSIGSIALADALRTYGGIKRVAFISPYFPIANIQIRRFLNDSGFEVVRDTALCCASWTDHAKVTEATLRKALVAIDGDDIDAICQVGTNLSMCKLAAEAEVWLGKPVLALNTVTYWHALRTCGINDRADGYGRLMAEM